MTTKSESKKTQKYYKFRIFLLKQGYIICYYADITIKEYFYIKRYGCDNE